MIIHFQTSKLLLFNMLALLVVLTFITTASYTQQRQNAIGQIEATVVFNGSVTSSEGQGSDASSTEDVFTNTTGPKQNGDVSQYEQTFMEAEISKALNSSSLTNQTTPTPTIAPTTTINEQQRKAAGNNIDTLNLTIGTNTYPITYYMTGGSVNNITSMQQNSTLIVDVATSGDGNLTIQLPRNVMDSKGPQNEDEDYIVFVDGIQTDTEEVISNNQTRTLSIDFEKGVEQIEIAGTRIIPEFGSEISMLLLSVSIIGILAFTTKYRKFRLTFV
jgi:hypothetical protein